MRQAKVYKDIGEVFLFRDRLFFVGLDKSLSRVRGKDIYTRTELSPYGGSINSLFDVLQCYHNKTLYYFSEEDLSVTEAQHFDAGHVSRIGPWIYCEDKIDRKTRHYRILKDGKTVFDRISEDWIRSIGDVFYWQERLTSHGMTRIDIGSGNELWSYDIRESGKYYDKPEGKWKEGAIVGNTIAPVDGRLILFGTDRSENGEEEGRQYVALDGGTGEVLWNQRSVNYGSGNIQFYGTDIISMNETRLFRIDSVTGAIKNIVDYKDRFEPGMSVYNAFRVIGNKIYFSQTRGEKRVGVIDLDSLELEHLFTVDTSAFQIDIPFANEGHLFVRDNENTIHVYHLA